MYTAIYRDFRPDSFDRLVGQDHIVRILKSQIASGQTGHAYLFCGTRGTGKTTTARILAKALNCEAEDRADRPCCECASCRAIKEGSFMDVVEIDAASNNGVDNIRELRESVKYPPVQGRNKVYIIDEVHMLSPGAFNALLKTLEEPPENVVFILATTEPQKLPATILSRCMRLDFRRVSENIIIENMKMICKARGLEAEDAALALIAVNADGSVRDSLSILEQCISTGESLITRSDVAEMLGTAGEEVMIEMTDCIMRSDMQAALILLDSAINSGRDVKQFMKEWLAHFRNLLMAKYIKDPENSLNMSLENAARVKEQSRAVSTDLLNRGITELTKTISESRWSVQPRVMLEMCIVRLGVGQQEELKTVFSYDGVQAVSEAAAAAVPDPAAGGGVSFSGASASGINTTSVETTKSGTVGVQSGMSDEELYLQSLIDSAAGFNEDPFSEPGAGMVFQEMQNQPYNAPTANVTSTAAAMKKPAVSAAVQPESEAGQKANVKHSQNSGGAGSAGPTREALELWNTVVKKSVGERPMLIRIENRAQFIGMDDSNFYVSVQDDITARIIKEKGRAVLEKHMEEYGGRHRTLRLAKQKGVPLAKEQDEAQAIADQIKEKFHIDVEIK